MSHLKSLCAAGVSSLCVSACYIIPAGPDGYPAWPPGAVWGPGISQPGPVQPPASAPAAARWKGSAPATLQARLYPSNDIATQTGVVSGTVTNMMSGKGRFVLDYRGEILSGEATRVSGDER